MNLDLHQIYGSLSPHESTPWRPRLVHNGTVATAILMKEEFTGVPNKKTNMCSNRPHLHAACGQCGLKLKI